MKELKIEEEGFSSRVEGKSRRGKSTEDSSWKEDEQYGKDAKE